MIIQNLDIDEYHASKAASNSKIFKLRQKGAEFYNRAFNLREAGLLGSTKAMDKGNAFDTLLFEGQDGFDKKYIYRPEGMKFTTKEGKAWKEVAESSGLVVIDDSPDGFGKMLHSIHTHPVASVLLSAGEAQVSLRVESEIWKNLPGVQCRPDWLVRTPTPAQIAVLKRNNIPSPERPFAVDLKSTVDFGKVIDVFDPLSQQNGKPIFNFGYYRQAALDQHVAMRTEISAMNVFFLFIETVEPYRAGMFTLSDDYFDIGMKELERDMGFLDDCYRTNTWPNSPTGLITLQAPAWLDMKAAREFDAEPLHDIYARD